MSFQIKILLLSFAVSTFIGMCAIPLLRRFKIKQTERTDGPITHLRKNGTPTMGGIILITATLILSALLYIDYTIDGAEGAQVATRLLPMIFVTLGYGVIGFIDDFIKVIMKNPKGISPKIKMMGLLVIAIIYVCLLVFTFGNTTDIYIPFVGIYWTMPVWLYIPFAIIVILATTNAVNLTDGVDGLSSSVTTVILATLTFMSIMLSVKETTIFASIVMGSTLGFLLFNLYPAHIIMGDTGSLLLGGAIAGIALYLKLPLMLLIIAIVPVIETISVIIQVGCFKLTGKRPFKMAPIHHHFELSGWKESKIVRVFTGVTLVASVIGLLGM